MKFPEFIQSGCGWNVSNRNHSMKRIYFATSENDAIITILTASEHKSGWGPAREPHSETSQPDTHISKKYASCCEVSSNFG